MISLTLLLIAVIVLAWTLYRLVHSVIRLNRIERTQNERVAYNEGYAVREADAERKLKVIENRIAEMIGDNSKKGGDEDGK